MMQLISYDSNFDFLGKRHIAIFISLLLVAGSIVLWFSKGEEKFGIDYLGGHELVVKIDESSSANVIRETLEKSGLDATVQAFESQDGEYSLRLSSGDPSGVVKGQVLKSLTGKYPDKVEVLKADFVGPTIGEELKRNALIAVVISLIGMLIYISIRFELAFAVGAVVALFHDVIVTMGLYLLCDMTISVATLAAALTIVGYSVNDTIIIFDRVREEILKARSDTPLKDIINKSINATLARTILTSLLTLFSAVALLVFGGGAIADLSLFMCLGLVAGFYSTIFIASPVAMAWERFQARASNSGNMAAAA